MVQVKIEILDLNDVICSKWYFEQWTGPDPSYQPVQGD